MNSPPPVHTEIAPRRRGVVWFELLGGGAAWTAHLILAYAAAEFGCVSGLGGRRWMGVSLVTWIELSLTAATALTAGAAFFVAWRRHRTAGLADVDHRYLAKVGVLANGVFTFIILFESIPILYFLDGC